MTEGRTTETDVMPLLIVLTAPSGAGKSTLCDMLLDDLDSLVYSISCTTRSPRGEEKDGIVYYFLSPSEFDCKLAANEFLEHARVHDHSYGTLRSRITDSLDSGLSVILDIDVQGASQVRAHALGAGKDDRIGRSYLDIFIEPPSEEELLKRLQLRGEDAPEVIDRRMKNAVRELACRKEFMHRVVNDDLGSAYAELKGIILTEQHSRSL